MSYIPIIITKAHHSRLPISTQTANATTHNKKDIAKEDTVEEGIYFYF